jgi:hypothetical protein
MVTAVRCDGGEAGMWGKWKRQTVAGILPLDFSESVDYIEGNRLPFIAFTLPSLP